MKTDTDRGKDISELTRNAGLTGISKFTNLGLKSVITFLITRILGADQFGVFVLGRTVVQMSGILSSLGLGPSLIRHIPTYRESPNRVNNLFRKSVIASFLFSSLVAVCIYYFSGDIANGIFSEPRLEPVIKVIFLGVPVLALLQVVFGGLNGLKLIAPRVVAENLLLPIVNIILIGVVHVLNLGLWGIIVAFLLANLVCLIFCFRVSLRNFSLKRPDVTPEENSQDNSELKRYSLPLLFSTTLNFLQRWADTFMLGVLSTTGAVGIYTVSMRLAYFIQIPLTSFNMIFTPLIAEIYRLGDRERLAYNYKMVTRVVLTLSLPIFGTCVLFPSELLSIFGKDFENGALAMVVICFGQLVNVSVGASGRMLVMTGHPRVNLINTGIFVALTILLNLWLIPEYDILGAGIANAVSFAVLNVVRTAQLYRFEGIQPFSPQTLKPLIAGAVAFGAVYLLKALVPLDGAAVRVATFLPVFWGAYALVIYLLRPSDDEMEMIRLLGRKLFRKRRK